MRRAINRTMGRCSAITRSCSAVRRSPDPGGRAAVDGSLVGLYSGLPGNRDERRNYPDHISSSRAEAVGRAGLPHRGGRALVSCLVPFEHGPGISDEDWRCEKNLSRSFKPLAGVVPRPVWRCHSNLPTFRFSTPRRLVRSGLAIVRANRTGP